MKPVKNFSEKINNERHTQLYVHGITESFLMHVDDANWLWIETSRSNNDINNCIRMEFRWVDETIKIHIIPIGMGIKHKKEMLIAMNPNDFVTYDAFQLWICKVIKSLYVELKD